MISFELNTAVKAKFTALGSPYSLVEFLPLSGYEDTQAPFVIFREFPGTLSEEKFFVSVANVVYVIYDNDIARMTDIAYELERFLNVGDKVEGIKSLLSVPYGTGTYRYRLTTSRKVSGNQSPAIEREGFSSTTLNFRVTYVQNSGTVG